MAEASIVDADAIVDRSRIGTLQVTVLVLGAFVLFVDGFDTQVIGFITPQIAKAWQIPRELLGPIFSSSLFGLLFGYLVLAPLSARFGHKRVIIASVASFGLLTMLTTTASSAWTLIAFRFLTGIGLGGAIPSAVALTGEYAPRRVRSTFITFMYCGLSFGQLAAGAVSATLLARFGWQTVLFVGAGLPLLLALVLALLLPESLEFLINRSGQRAKVVTLLRRIERGVAVPDGARIVAGERGGRTGPPIRYFQNGLTVAALRRYIAALTVTQLFRNERMVGTIAIWVGLAMNLFVNFFLQTWLTTLYIDVGVDQETAIWLTSVSLAGGIFAAFAIGPLMDWLGPYAVMAGLFLAGSFFVAGIGFGLHWHLLVIAGISFFAGFCTSGIQKSSNALCIYFYPTALRSTGLGWGLGIGRIGAILGPLAAGFLLGLGWTRPSLFYAAAIPMLVGAAAITTMGTYYRRATVRRRANEAAE